MTRADLAGRFRQTPVRRWLPLMLAVLCLCAHAAGSAPTDEPQPRTADPTAQGIRVLTWNVLEPSPLERLLEFVFETQATTRARALLR